MQQLTLAWGMGTSRYREGVDNGGRKGHVCMPEHGSLRVCERGMVWVRSCCLEGEGSRMERGHGDVGGCVIFALGEGDEGEGIWMEGGGTGVAIRCEKEKKE